MSYPKIKRADWVSCIRDPGAVGFVQRVARDGSWADVKWRVGQEEYTKRMPTANLQVEHTIDFMPGWTVTDVTRKQELVPVE